MIVVIPGEVLPREKHRSHPNSSSETHSSSSSSHGFISKGVITQVPQAPVPQQYEEPYPMECDKDGFGLQSRCELHFVLIH